MNESRTHKSILNAKVNLLFFLLSLALSFFSRKVFLDNLGADFIGLTGTLLNILGFLNLAEFGITSSISFFLYKPLQAKNKERVSELLTLFGYIYQKIGLLIGAGGIIVSLFFPFIFQKTIFNFGIIYFAFYFYLAASLLGYFLNYKPILLVADQKGYIVNSYYQTTTIIKTIIQILLAWYFKNLYIWISIEFIFNLIACITLNWKIKKVYPWLHTDLSEGKALLKKNSELLTYTKQIFIHKIKDFLLNRSDEILIFAFASLKMVAYYGNYMLIITKINQIINTILESVGAGVGHLIAEGNKKKILQVFWELMALRYFISGIIVFALFHLLEPFITLWLGYEYILGKTILTLLIITVFIIQTRGTVDSFNHSHGLYADIWAAWTEGIINLGVTIVAASYWGIAGVLLGKIASILPIVVFWKPYYLFSSGLKLPISLYWKGTIRYHAIFSISFIIFSFISKLLPFNPKENFAQLIYYAICLIFPFIIFYFILFLYFSPGMKDLLNRFSLTRKIKNKLT